MKFLALVSSYRKQGNTARILRMVTEALEALSAQAGRPIDVETINLAHRKIESCRGCRVCFDRGADRCPLKDDVAELRAQVEEADGLILASPVYVEDVNGVMKNWIDRMAYVCHRPALFSKYAYVLSTSGVGSSNHTLRTMSTALSTWGVHVVGRAKFPTGGLMADDEMARRYGEQTRKIAEQIVRSVRAGEAGRPSFVSLVTFKVQQLYWIKNADDSLDSAYWSDKGWVDPQRTYYVPHESGRLKVALARSVGAVVARFVI